MEKDRIIIRDLRAGCIIGTRPEERTTPQEIALNIEIETDLRRAGKSDDLKHTVNYSDLRHRILAMVRQSSFCLVERMAEEVAQICLQEDLVARVTVAVDKPAALQEARSVAVRICRSRGK